MIEDSDEFYEDDDDIEFVSDHPHRDRLIFNLLDVMTIDDIMNKGFNFDESSIIKGHIT